LGYKILGVDGEIGHVFDFYFDDVAWTARYIVVDTGEWLPGRKVLLSPMVAGRPDSANHCLPVDLTKAQIVDSPPIEVDKPVDRQYEELLSDYYGWPVYWMGYPDVPFLVGPVMAGEAVREMHDSPKYQRREREVAERGDPHLRSLRDVSGYQIHTEDDAIGHINDFIAETKGWVIRYLVCDTGNWLPGKKVLIAPEWINSVNWERRTVDVSMTTEVGEPLASVKGD
jgi:hypothetical protein